MSTDNTPATFTVRPLTPEEIARAGAGLLLPAVQKIREAAMSSRLGTGKVVLQDFHF